MWRPTAAASLMLVATVALADDNSACLDSNDHDLRIKSCSAIIERNPKDAVAHDHRGEAHELKGEIDRAISDYTKAIVADPNYAPAYEHRGRAYVSKGDYVRAVDDVTRASELARKQQPKPAVVEAAPNKQKKEAIPSKSVPPVASKSVPPVPSKSVPSVPGKTVLPVPGKSPVTESPSTLGKAPVGETLPEDGKASKVENSGESTWLGRWPAWMPR